MLIPSDSVAWVSVFWLGDSSSSPSASLILLTELRLSIPVGYINGLVMGSPSGNYDSRGSRQAVQWIVMSVS